MTISFSQPTVQMLRTFFSKTSFTTRLTIPVTNTSSADARWTYSSSGSCGRPKARWDWRCTWTAFSSCPSISQTSFVRGKVGLWSWNLSARTCAFGTHQGQSNIWRAKNWKKRCTRSHPRLKSRWFGKDRCWSRINRWEEWPIFSGWSCRIQESPTKIWISSLKKLNGCQNSCEVARSSFIKLELV